MRAAAWIAAAEEGKGVGEGGEFFGVEGFVVLVLAKRGGAMSGHGGGDAVSESSGAGGVEFLGVGGEVGGGLSEGLVGEPFFESALAPLGDVLFVDGAAVELLLEDFLDFRKVVKPLEKVGGFDAVLQGKVYGGAKIERSRAILPVRIKGKNQCSESESVDDFG